MNIQNLYGSIATGQTSSVSPLSTSTTTTGGVASGACGQESATISTPAQLFSEMQQLSQSNPSQFKAVAAQLATSFQTAASQATGNDAQALNNLANQFSQAAQTGSLQPPQAQSAAAVGQAGGASGSGGAHHHHHHHHGGGSAGGGQSSAIDQAFQSAMTILSQATQGTTTTATQTATT